jgi:hypothetical protein
MVDIKIKYKGGNSPAYEGNRWEGTDPNHSKAMMCCDSSGHIIWAAGRFLGFEILDQLERIEIGVR